MTPISCQETLQRLYEYLDGELPPDSTAEVRRHIELCAGCYPEVKNIAEFRDALHRAAQGQPVCPDSLRRKVAELLGKEGPGAA
jgi:anti-sigma factor (TIGR02949 family)